MKYKSVNQMFRQVCKADNKFGLLIYYYVEDLENGELFKACPFLTREFISEASPQTHLTFYFNTEKELYSYFDQVVGDEGPTKLNPYNGPCLVYALTCDNEGNLLDVNC